MSIVPHTPQGIQSVRTDDDYPSPGDVSTRAQWHIDANKDAIYTVLRMVSDEIVFGDGPGENLSALDIATTSGRCVEHILHAINFLGSRGVVSTESGSTDCMCASCQARQLFVGLPFDWSIDYEDLVRERRASQHVAPPRKTPSFVYIIQSPNAYKIGRSKDPDARMKQLQTASADELRLVHTRQVDDPVELEAHLHTLFADTNTSGEWFQLDELMLQRAVQEIDSWESGVAE